MHVYSKGSGQLICFGNEPAGNATKAWFLVIPPPSHVNLSLQHKEVETWPSTANLKPVSGGTQSFDCPAFF
jgi:hypothetical protein